MIARVGIWLLLVCLALVSILAAFLVSPWGSSFLVRSVEDWLEPTLSIDGINGSLLSRLCAESVHYHQPTVDITVSDLCVTPNLWSSIDFLQVSLESVEAARIEIQTLAGDNEEDEPPAELRLPLVIEVGLADVEMLNVNNVEVSGLDTSLSLSNSDLVSASSLTYDGRRIRLQTDGGWSKLRARLESDAISAVVVADLTDTRLPFDIQASTSRLDLGEWIDRQVVLEAVQVAVEGNLEGYRYELSTSFLDAYATGEAQLSGNGDLQSLSFSGTVERADLADVDVHLDRLETEGQLSWSNGVELQIRGELVKGVINGVAVTAEMDAGIDESHLSLNSARVRATDFQAAELKLTGSLSFDGELGVELQAESVPLTILGGGFGDSENSISGSISGLVALEGPVDTASIQGRYRATDLLFEETALDELSGTIAGRLDRAEVELVAKRGDLQMETRVDYVALDSQLDLNLSELVLIREGDSLPLEIRLLEPVSARITQGSAMVKQACFILTVEGAGFEPASGCLAFDYPTGGGQFTLEPWVMPESFVGAGAGADAGVADASEDIGLSGRVAAQLTVETFEPLIGSASIRLSELRALSANQKARELGGVAIELGVADGVLRASVLSDPDPDLALSGSLVSMLAPEVGDSVIEGEINLGLDGIWLAEQLLPMDVSYELAQLQGEVMLSALVSGTLTQPELTGRLRLSDLGWKVVALNTRFSDFVVDAELVDSTRLTLVSNGNVGDGRVTFSGVLDPIIGANPELTTEFSFEGTQLVDLPDFSAIFDGNLSLKMDAESLRFGGELLLTEALLKINELPESALSASADEVLVDEQLLGKEGVALQQLRTTDLKLELGDHVRLLAFGLDTRLTGTLRLREAPGEQPQLTGTINLREGKFEAYGQALKVDRGRLVFTGPVDDPIVDVAASRVVNHEDRDISITLLITGTAEQLETAVRSSPAIPESDALALLMTGRTFNQISNSEQSNVYGAAISLGVMGVSSLAGGVAGTLGVEEIIIDQDDSGQMEVGAALRITQDLYLRYTYGVISRLGGVLVRYRLNKRLSVQAKTGDTQSIEIRYGVDE